MSDPGLHEERKDLLSVSNAGFIKPMHEEENRNKEEMVNNLNRGRINVNCPSE